MANVDPNSNADTLESLRSVRRALYAIPERVLDAMSHDDQMAYGDNLFQISETILKLETAQLKAVNDDFKTRESELTAAAQSLRDDLTGLTDAVQIIGAVSSGLSLVTDVVKLLS